MQRKTKRKTKLRVVVSPYRFILNPLLQYIEEEVKKHPGRQIAVIIPERVDRHWYHYFLHNKPAALLKAQLIFRETSRWW